MSESDPYERRRDHPTADRRVLERTTATRLGHPSGVKTAYNFLSLLDATVQPASTIQAQAVVVGAFIAPISVLDGAI